MVLLRNENGILPLTPKTAGEKVKIAVLGPHYNSSTELLANYFGDNNLVQTSTPLAALSRRPEVEVVGALAGCDLVNVSIPPDIEGATNIAKKADIAIVFLGLHSTQVSQFASCILNLSAQNSTSFLIGQGKQVANGPGMEREGFDRTNLTLPGYQPALIEAVVGTGTPTVVVLINSGGIAAEWVYSNVPAILEAYYPGELGGDAIASLLLGDKSPSGRLTTTIYPADFVMQRNITDMNFRAHGDIPGVTYRFVDRANTLFSFGYGKHYTSFAFAFKSSGSVTATTDFICSAGRRGVTPTVTISVTNTGHVESDVSILCFVLSNETSTNAPRQLAGFSRLSRVQPSATDDVDIEIIPAALRSTDTTGAAFALGLTYELQCGGEPDGFAHATLTVSGPRCSIFSYPAM